MGSKKLNDAQVRAMRVLWSTGEFTQEEIRSWFNISATHCQKVLSGERRSGAGGPVGEGPGTRERRRELTNEQVKKVREQFARGEQTQGELAHSYGVTRGYVSHLVRATARKDAGGPVRGEDYEEPGEWQPKEKTGEESPRSPVTT